MGSVETRCRFWQQIASLCKLCCTPTVTTSAGNRQ